MPPNLPPAPPPPSSPPHPHIPPAPLSSVPPASSSPLIPLLLCNCCVDRVVSDCFSACLRSSVPYLNPDEFQNILEVTNGTRQALGHSGTLPWIKPLPLSVVRGFFLWLFFSSTPSSVEILTCDILADWLPVPFSNLKRVLMFKYYLS